MKKKDIIQLVKKAIKEVDQFGNRQGPSNFQTSAVTSAGKDPYTGKNEYPFSKRPKRTATGMMESRIDQSKVFDQSEIDRIIGEVREITGILEDTYNTDVNYKEFRFDDGTGGFQFQWAHSRNWGGRFGLSLNENGAHELSALSYYDKSSSGSENIRPNNPIILDIETWKDLDTSMLVEIWSQLKPMVIKNEAAAREALSREAKAQSDYYGSKADTGRIGYGLSSQPRRRNESVNEVRTSTISKKRAGAELKQKLKGKRSDGMGKYDGKIYGLDNDGKRVELKSLNDLNKFTKFELDADLNESVVEKVIAQIKEGKPGLWANIRAKKERGEKPAHGNSDAHKTAVKAGKKINKLNEDEEDQFAAELDGFADQLAAEIKDELEDHKEEIQKSDKDLNEIVGVVGILGYILLSNTVANMLSKFAKKQFAKRDFGKGEAAAKKIYDFTHKNEEAFKAPIKRIVGIFTKNEKKKKMISDILYAIVILLMAGQAGGNAVGYIKKAGYLKGGLYGLKAAVKGTEVATILKGVVADAVS